MTSVFFSNGFNALMIPLVRNMVGKKLSNRQLQCTRRAQTVPQLINVTVKILSPIKTCKLKTLYAGCVAAIKLRYCSFQLESALDLSEEGVTEVIKL